MATENSRSVNSERKSQWTVTVVEDGDDLVLPLPEDMLETLGWNTGDTLKWEQLDDQTWTLRKKELSESEDA